MAWDLTPEGHPPPARIGSAAFPPHFAEILAVDEGDGPLDGWLGKQPTRLLRANFFSAASTSDRHWLREGQPLW